MTHRIAVGAVLGPLGVLMCHRRPSLQRYPAKWDFPGGHIEDGETAGEALARELLEEVNIRITVPEEAPTFRVQHNHGAPDGLALSGWVITEWSGVPENLARDEHDHIRWFTPSQALGLDLAHHAYFDLLKQLTSGQQITVDRDADTVTTERPPGTPGPGPRYVS